MHGLTSDLCKNWLFLLYNVLIDNNDNFRTSTHFIIVFEEKSGKIGVITNSKLNILYNEIWVS